LAKQDISPVLDFFIRREDIQLISWIGITPGSSKKVMEAKPEVPDSVSDYIIDVFSRSGTETSQVLPIYLFEFFSYMHEPEITPFAMTIELLDKGNKLQFPTLAVFQDHRMVGELSSDEIMYIQLLRNQALMPTNFTVQDKSINLIAYDRSISFKDRAFQSEFDLTFTIETSTDIQSFTDQKIAALEGEIEEFIEKETLTVIKKTQKLKVDPVGFGFAYRTANNGRIDSEI
jgi:spore germination protein KC